MQIVIDIPEETYNKIRRGEPLYPADANVAIFAIETGIPLEESEDCVSRQAVLDKASYTETEEGWSGFTVDVDDIKALSPVTPQKDALDKIRAEIENTLYVDSLIFGELMDFKEGKITADDVIEEFNRVTRAEVLQIIDGGRHGHCRIC